MTKDVIVTITGLQYMGNEKEAVPVEVMMPGQYFLKNGQHYLLYDEVMDGFDNVTHNIIKFGTEKLEMRKRGLINVQMIFEASKKNLSYYETPFGIVNMGVAATNIRIDECPDVIKVLVDYALDLNDTYAADCTIAMTIRSK